METIPIPSAQKAIQMVGLGLSLAVLAIGLVTVVKGYNKGK